MIASAVLRLISELGYHPSVFSTGEEFELARSSILERYLSKKKDYEHSKRGSSVDLVLRRPIATSQDS